MNKNKDLTDSVSPGSGQQDKVYFRFHQQHSHLAPVFGNDWLALKAEAFARFFGTPVFLMTQTVIVLVWIGLN